MIGMNMKTRGTAVLLAAILVMTLLLPGTAAVAEQKGVVKGGWLILRASPSFNGQIRSSYPSGTVVTITGQVGSWYAVTAPDGLNGYMFGDYLQVDGGGGGGGVR